MRFETPALSENDAGAHLFRVSSHGDEVDAVSVAGVVGQVVSQVCPGQGHRLSVLEAAHGVPVHLFIAEGRPPVRVRLLLELSPGATLRSSEQQRA